MNHTYDIPGLKGQCCRPNVARAVKNSPYAEHEFLLDLEKKTLTFKLKDSDALGAYDPNKLQALLDEALKAEGLSCKPPHAKLGALGLVVGLVLLLLPVVMGTLPMAALACIAVASTGLTGMLGFSFYRSAAYNLRDGYWTMDTLFSISTAAILAISLAGLFVPGLPLMFEAGLFIFGFRHTGIAIADYFRDELATAKHMQFGADHSVRRRKPCGMEENVPLASIKAGDVLILSAGMVLPVDGMFLSGKGQVSNAHQTGDSTRNPLECNQVLVAGTKLESIQGAEALLLRASSSAKHSYLAERDEDIREKKWKKKLEHSSLHSKTTGYLLQIFVPAVMTVAALSGLVVGLFFSWMLALQCVACVLVAACPCALGLITPLLISLGKEKAKKAGFDVNVSEALEVLGAVDTVFLDLNGTCTEGDTRVKSWVSFDEEKLSSDAFLAVMASLEQGSEHRVAKAIQRAADARNIVPLQGEYEPSLFKKGREVFLHGTDYVLGNRATMRDIYIKDEAINALNIPQPKVGESILYLSSYGVIQGYVVLQDTLRKGVPEFVAYLKAQNIEACLLTGDARLTAELYGPYLGIDTKNIHAECTVEKKEQLISSRKEKGKCVAMIGDGGNDTEAFLASDVAIAVKHTQGDKVAQQSAEIMLEAQSLHVMTTLFQIAKDTLSNIKQTVGLSFIYNALAVFAPMGLLFGAGVMMNPAVGAALMMLQTVLIFANVYRFYAEDVHEVVPEITPKPDLISAHGNTNISSICNRVRFAHTNSNGLDSEITLDGVDDTQGDSLDEFKRVGLH